MPIWSAEIKELERLHESLKGQLPDLEKELERLIKADDENMILLYSRRCLEVIITDLCECQLKRERGTEPLKGIIDKLNKEKKVPSHIITSMHGLNELSTYGTHPKDFDPEQVKPVLINLDIIIKWYMKYKEIGKDIKVKQAQEVGHDIDSTKNSRQTYTLKKKKLFGIISGLILLIAIIIAVLYFTIISSGGKPKEETDKSIAVIPFTSMSDDPAKQYLADGVMDAILLHLSKIRDLRVIARTSVEQYRKTNKTTTTICKELDVGYLLEGSFQKYGDNAKLIVQLIKAGKGSHVWAKDYDRNWNDVLKVQSEVAQTVAKELYASITPEEKQLIEKAPTTDTAAYELYLRAKDYQRDYEKTRDINSYYKAINLYNAALILDSAFAKAYTGLAAVYYSRNYYKTYFEQDFLDSCLVLINKALAFDSQLDEAYYLKGIYYQSNGQLLEAMNNFDKALKINPNYYLAYVAKGGKWISIDFVGSITNYQKALNLIGGDDRSSLLKDLGLIYVDIGFFDKAKSYYLEALKMDGDSADYFGNLAVIEFTAENLENAVILIEKESKIDSTISLPFEFYSFTKQDQKAYMAAVKEIELLNKSGKLPLLYSHRIGYAFWKAGKFKEANYYFKEQIKYGTESIKLGREYSSKKSSQFDLAAVYAFLGDKTKAYQYLDDFNTLTIYPKWWISYAKYDPMFESIRNEERFQKILRNMESKYQAEHDRVQKWLEEQGML